MDTNTNINDKTKIVLNDDFKIQLFKVGIDVDKWCHKLLTCQYFDSKGKVYYHNEQIEELSINYLNALKLNNIQELVSIKNNLITIYSDKDCLHNLLIGNICSMDKTPLNSQCQSIINLSNEYKRIIE